MNVFVRAVVTGFGFSLGAALFRKVSERLGLGEDKDAEKDRSGARTDPGSVVTPGTGAPPGENQDLGAGAAPILS